jgi:hypothetical protein
MVESMGASIWQDLYCCGRFRHWWQHVDARRLHAMTTAIFVLLLVAGLVALSIVRPALPVPFHLPVDRDRERQLAELRALPACRADVQVP